MTDNYGKGFSVTNLKNMRKFYNVFSISQTLSDQLTWSHYLELIKIDDTNKRNFYMHECINSNWNVRELQRQRDTLLYERLVISKDKSKISNLANDGNKLQKIKDIIKDPFVLEFLDIKEKSRANIIYVFDRIKNEQIENV